MNLKVKKVSCLLCVLLLYTTWTWGQGVFNKSDDFVNKYEWDVSLDTYRLFRNGGATVFIKYAPSITGAYRLAIEGGGLTKLNNETGYLNGSNQKGNIIQYSSNSGITTGYEWRKSKYRHQIYYGTDISFTYRSSRTHTINYNISQISPSRDYIFSVIPFVGLSYQFSDRLSFSAEMNLSFSHSIRNILSQDRSNIEASSKSTSFGFTPLRLINLSYHF